MVTLPTEIPSASGWQFHDWTQLALTAASVSVTDLSGGTSVDAVIETPQLPHNEQWLVDRLVITCQGSAKAEMLLSSTSSGLIDGTPRGNFNVAEYPTGLLVRPSSGLIARWYGMDFVGPNAVSLRLQARVYRRP